MIIVEIECSHAIEYIPQDVCIIKNFAFEYKMYTNGINSSPIPIISLSKNQYEDDLEITPHMWKSLVKDKEYKNLLLGGSLQE